MEKPNNTITDVLEGIVTEILVRLPLRSISRFKSVSQTWKSAIESVYFRRLFLSLHQNTSSSWSLLLRKEEFIDFHGCRTWGLPKSLGSYIQCMELDGKFEYMWFSGSNGLILMHRKLGTWKNYVGNPVLQQWVEIPACPGSYTFFCGVVTGVDEVGVVLSFKVVKSGFMFCNKGEMYMPLYVYSSKTGFWIHKEVVCPVRSPNFYEPISLNGTLYFSQRGDSYNLRPGLMVLDFYGKPKDCHFIPLPDHALNRNKTCLATSSGFVMYIKTLAQPGGNLLKVWRLIDDSAWQLMWEVSIPFIGCYAPMSMHPFDRNIVYLWSHDNCYLMSFNLQTQNYKIFGDESKHHDCYINHRTCEKHMYKISRPYSVSEYEGPIILHQWVLSRWMESVPRPPEVEMIDTTSLLSLVVKNEE